MARAARVSPASGVRSSTWAPDRTPASAMAAATASRDSIRPLSSARARRRDSSGSTISRQRPDSAVHDGFLSEGLPSLIAMSTTTSEVPQQSASRDLAVDLAPPVLGSLSPSRPSDFMACPLRYRFRALDKLPEPPSPAATRGTLVHSVLEQLFDLPPLERTPEAAAALLAPTWQQAVAEQPE